MTPLLHFSAGSISLIPRSSFKNTKKEIHLNKCNFKRRPLLLPQPTFPLSWISSRSISKTRTLTSAVEADMAVEADPNPNPETSQDEFIEEKTEKPASTSRDVWVKGTSPSRKGNLPAVKKEDLVPGAKFTGIVRSMHDFGIFVNIGSFTDGLVHVSEISNDYVKDVKALFTTGQQVEVRVLEYDTQAGRISLTMRPPGTEKKGGGRGKGQGGRRGRQLSYKKGNVFEGIVKEITEEGALVTLPGDVEGFLPVSEQDVYVEDVEDVEDVEAEGDRVKGNALELDQEIEVQILSVEQGKITLTMKFDYMDEDEEDDKMEEEDEEDPSYVLRRRRNSWKEEKKEEEEWEEEEEELDEDLDDTLEGEEGEDVTGEVTEEDEETNFADITSGPILPNPFTYAFQRSKYAPNVKKRLELMTAVKNEDSEVGEVAVSSGSSEAGSASIIEEPVAVAEAEGGEVAAVGEVAVSSGSSEAGSASITEEPVAVAEAEGSEVAAVGEVAVSSGSSEPGSASIIEEPVAVAEAEGSEVAAVGEVAVSSDSSEAGSASIIEEPVVVAEAEGGEVAAVGEEPVGAVSETASTLVSEEPVVESAVEEVEVAAAGAVSGVTESEVTKEVEKGEVTAAAAVTEAADSENASDTTVSEASTGTTDSTSEDPAANEPVAVTSEVEAGEVTAVGAMSDSTVSEDSASDSQAVLSEGAAREITGKEETEEEVVSIKVGDEKTEVPQATPEASPAREVQATISPSLVKQLRDETGAGMMDCKKALTETNGDLAKAQEYLRKKGLASADKKSSRATAEGRIGSYVHDGRIGVLVEVNCETDFVSRGDIFKELVEDLAMQVAACPQVTYLTSEEVPEEMVKKEKEIEMQREDILSKPENIREKIVEGRIRKHLEEFALLEQPFIKNDKVVVKDYVKQTIATIGENIQVKRFVRFNLGEGLEKKSQDFAAEVAAQTAAKPTVTAADAAQPKDEKAETTETAEKAPEATVTISPALVKQLRDETGAGMMDCKKALAETGGDIEKAQEYLRKKGLSSADKKSSRVAAEGLISAYIHDSRIGCLIEVNSETDFVARNEKFKELASDLAMQVVACPQVEFVSIDEVPASVVEKEKAIEMQREDLQSKPEQIREKIVEGRISKRLGELALLEQPFIKDDSITVEELMKRTIASLGENIKVRRFVRFTLGENKD